MGYTTGHDILDDEYNTFATGTASGTPNHSFANINTVLGSGLADKGYGQLGATVVPVSIGADVTAIQWASMLNAVNTIASHQGTALGTVDSPLAGDDISVIAALTNNISLITSNRLNTISTDTPEILNTDYVAPWNEYVTTSMTATFGSEDEMRYFFNTGGRLALSASRTGGSASSKNTGWTTLLNNMGTIHITAASGAGTATIAATAYTGTTKTGGGGLPAVLNTGIGFYDLTGVEAEVFQQFASTPAYTTNYVSVKVKVVGAVITVAVTYQDDEFLNNDELVDGSTSTILQAIPSASLFISDSWGTITLGGSTTGT